MHEHAYHTHMSMQSFFYAFFELEGEVIHELYFCFWQSPRPEQRCTVERQYKEISSSPWLKIIVIECYSKIAVNSTARHSNPKACLVCGQMLSMSCEEKIMVLSTWNCWICWNINCFWKSVEVLKYGIVDFQTNYTIMRNSPGLQALRRVRTWAQISQILPS